MVTAPPQNAQVYRRPWHSLSLPFMRLSHRPHAAAPKGTHRAPRFGKRRLDSVRHDELKPVVHDEIMDAARRKGIAPKQVHVLFLRPSRRFIWCLSTLACAILTKSKVVGCSAEDVVVKPLAETLIVFETCLIMRTNDDSRLANEFRPLPDP